MEKQFNFTPLECNKEKLMCLFEETKYTKLDLYIKLQEKNYHIIFEELEDCKESDFQYTFNDEKFKTYEEFKYKVNNILDTIDTIEVLEVDGDGPHYHKVFSNDYVNIEREVVEVVFDYNENVNVESELKVTLKKPSHIWIVIENLVYIAVIIFSGIYGCMSLLNYGADIFNVGLLILTLFLIYFCFKDYLKYKVEIYNDKIIFPNIKTKDFTVAYKTFREIKYNEIYKISYVNNPKTGKVGREIAVICKDGSQRIISLNAMNKNQYIDVATSLVENINEYYNEKSEIELGE